MRSVEILNPKMHANYLRRRLSPSDRPDAVLERALANVLVHRVPEKGPKKMHSQFFLIRIALTAKTLPTKNKTNATTKFIFSMIFRFSSVSAITDDQTHGTDNRSIGHARCIYIVCKFHYYTSFFCPVPSTHRLQLDLAE